jgi:hypothetical protein
MAEEAKAESKPAAVSSPVERVREAAKWLIGAFAAIGALLVAGIQLSDAGQLTLEDDKDRLIAAIAGLIFGFGGVMWAILENVRMLLPAAMTIDRLKTEEGLAPFFNDNPELIPGPPKSVDDFVTAFWARSDAYDSAKTKYEETYEDTDKAKLEKEKKRLGVAEREMREVLSLANWKATERLFNDDVRWRLVGAAIIATVGIALFAWAANPPEEEKESAEKPVLGVAPSLGRLTFKPEAESQLKQALGESCEIGKVRVLVIGGTKKEPEVISIPEAGCDAVRFVGGPEIAEVIPIR